MTKQETLRICCWLLTSAAMAMPSLGQQPAEVSPGIKPLLVTMELTLADDPSVAVTVPDGTMATFEHADRDYRIGLIPHVVDADNGAVEIEVVSIAGAGGSANRGRTLDRLAVRRGFRVSTAAVGRQVLDLTVQSVGHSAPEWATSCAPPDANAGLGETANIVEENQTTGCCVTCGGSTVCGCAVSRSCGSCCNCSFC